VFSYLFFFFFFSLWGGLVRVQLLGDLSLLLEAPTFTRKAAAEDPSLDLLIAHLTKLLDTPDSRTPSSSPSSSSSLPSPVPRHAVVMIVMFADHRGPYMGSWLQADVHSLALTSMLRLTAARGSLKGVLALLYMLLTEPRFAEASYDATIDIEAVLQTFARAMPPSFSSLDPACTNPPPQSTPLRSSSFFFFFVLRFSSSSHDSAHPPLVACAADAFTKMAHMVTRAKAAAAVAFDGQYLYVHHGASPTSELLKVGTGHRGTPPPAPMASKHQWSPMKSLWGGWALAGTVLNHVYARSSGVPEVQASSAGVHMAVVDGRLYFRSPQFVEPLCLLVFDADTLQLRDR
jgi:hypothetical protein